MAGPFNVLLPNSWIHNHLRVLAPAFPTGPDCLMKGPHSAQPLPERSKEYAAALHTVVKQLLRCLEGVFGFDKSTRELKLTQSFEIPAENGATIQPRFVLRQAVDILVTAAMSLHHCSTAELIHFDKRSKNGGFPEELTPIWEDVARVSPLVQSHTTPSTDHSFADRGCSRCASGLYQAALFNWD